MIKMSKNHVYIGICLSLSGLYFVVTGIQYWLSDYLIEVMNVDPDKAAVYFSLTCFTAPISGVIVGGFLTTHLGGYNDPRA